MIDDIFLKKLIEEPQKILSLEFKTIKDIIGEATDIAEKEYRLLKIDTTKKEEIFIFGDIHGKLSSLKLILKEIQKRKPEYIISLGDIVDRGDYQLQTLIIMCALKILNPKNFFILRGNHETFEMNRSYGFYDKFIEKFGNNHKFDVILDFYNSLPYSIIINESILCVHGGIPEDNNILKKLKDLKLDKMNDDLSEEIDKALFQIMWNDPKEEVSYFKPSYRGPGILFFGKDALDEFLQENNLDVIIRAHESFPEGYRWFFGKKLLTIFSAENYRPNLANPAVYALIENQDQIRVKIL